MVATALGSHYPLDACVRRCARSPWRSLGFLCFLYKFPGTRCATLPQESPAAHSTCLGMVAHAPRSKPARLDRTPAYTHIDTQRPAQKNNNPSPPTPAAPAPVFAAPALSPPHVSHERRAHRAGRPTRRLSSSSNKSSFSYPPHPHPRKQSVPPLSLLRGGFRTAR